MLGQQDRRISFREIWHRLGAARGRRHVEEDEITQTFASWEE